MDVGEGGRVGRAEEAGEKLREYPDTREGMIFWLGCSGVWDS